MYQNSFQDQGENRTIGQKGAERYKIQRNLPNNLHILYNYIASRIKMQIQVKICKCSLCIK